jgi:GT2 family glycosyltransferase
MEADTEEVLQYPLSGPARIWGANMVFRRSIFDHVGLFNVELGPSGKRPVNFEDLEMVERVLRNGRKVVYDPALIVYHRIPSERMRMRYFRRWAFATGRAAAVRGTTDLGRLPLFGRPFWLYHETARLLGEWLIAALLRRPRALERQLDFLNKAGCLWWFREVAGRARSNRGGIASADRTPKT